MRLSSLTKAIKIRHAPCRPCPVEAGTRWRFRAGLMGLFHQRKHSRCTEFCKNHRCLGMILMKMRLPWAKAFREKLIRSRHETDQTGDSESSCRRFHCVWVWQHLWRNAGGKRRTVTPNCFGEKIESPNIFTTYWKQWRSGKRNRENGDENTERTRGGKGRIWW